VIGPPQVAITANANPKLNREAQAAAECRGFGRVLCGYRRGFYGIQLLNKDLSGGPFPGRDFCLATPAPCDDHAKDSGPTADIWHIPRWQREAPRYIGPRDAKRGALMAENMVQDELEVIDWLQKTTGLEFDDESFIESARIEWQFHKLAGQAFCLNQNIPAPLDMKSLYSFYTLGGLVKSAWKETEDFWRSLRDELQWRVDNHIAAVPTERFRFIEHEPPPWHYLRYLRYLETYGAVGLGSLYCFAVGGPYEIKADGTWTPKKNPLDLNMPLRNREDVIRARVAFSQNPGLTSPGNTNAFPGRYGIIKTAAAEVANFAKSFHADGAILPLHLTGVGCVWGMKEIALKVHEAGVDVMHYETSQPGDANNLDENQLLDRIDAWMESHGLERLED
jgi:benzoyl-CoA reductase subunit B